MQRRIIYRKFVATDFSSLHKLGYCRIVVAVTSNVGPLTNEK